MKTLCVISCGSRKVWHENLWRGATRARHVYIGPFARKCREYAERFHPEEWCVLSAKHGFLYPDDMVPGPYNVSFNDPKSGPISAHALRRQLPTRGLHRYDQVVVLGGRNYVQIIEQVFPDRPVLAPLRDYRGIGYMMGALNDAILNDAPLQILSA